MHSVGAVPRVRRDIHSFPVNVLFVIFSFFGTELVCVLFVRVKVVFLGFGAV